MQNVIVVLKPESSNVLEDVLRAATQGQEFPSGVTKISNEVWLIDIHKSLPFFASLFHAAHTRPGDVLVFAVEELLYVPKGLENLDQKGWTWLQNL